MSATYEPGDVCVATVRGVPNVRVMRTSGDGSAKWFSADLIEGFRWHNTWHFDEARPLVVIDPEDREQVEQLAAIYCDDKVNPGVAAIPTLVVARLRNALREFANPKPPKPAEPQGLGAVVEDAEGEAWSRRADGAYVCLSAGPQLIRTWSNLDAVRKLSEGVPA